MNVVTDRTQTDLRVRQHCPVCGAVARVLEGAGADQARLCTSCWHTFVRTLPSDRELVDLYDSYGYDSDLIQLPAFLDAILSEMVARFERFRKTNRLLDVGFGAAGLLRAARTNGWDAHGVELSRAAVERARAGGISTVVNGDFRHTDVELGSFDVVVMTELIEHLPDPGPYVARAAEVLREGGLLYVTTPHGRGLSGRLLGSSWSVLRPPEHLQLFSCRSLRHLAFACGFREATVYTQGLLPHEIVAKLRPASRRERKRSEPVRAEDGLPSRTTSAYALNEKLTTKPLGRAMKRAANVVLRTTMLGDSLRLEAVR